MVNYKPSTTKEKLKSEEFVLRWVIFFYFPLSMGRTEEWEIEMLGMYKKKCVEPGD